MALQEVQFLQNNFMLDASARVSSLTPPITTMFEAPNNRALVPISFSPENVTNVDSRKGVKNFNGARVAKIDFGTARSPSNMIMVFRGLELSTSSEMIVAPVSSSSIRNYSGITTYKGWRAGAEIFYLYLETQVSSRYWNVIFSGNVGPLDDIFFGGAVDVRQVISSGLGHQTNDPSQITYADSGRQYAVRRPKYQVLNSLRLPFLDRTQVTAFKNFSDLKGLTEPFWVAIDPNNRWDGPAFGATFGAYRFAAMPVFNHDFLDKFTASFSLREVL